MFANELLRQEQARLNEARKISVVNVNPTNIRPHSDTPEIRKYKKRFNSEILCAALWGKEEHALFSPMHQQIPPFINPSVFVLCSGVNLLVGTENGLMLLDRSGQGKVYNLITRRRFLQMDVLEGLNVLVTISGKYYVSYNFCVYLITSFQKFTSGVCFFFFLLLFLREKEQGACLLFVLAEEQNITQ